MRKLALIMLAMLFVWTVYTNDGWVYWAHSTVQRGVYVYGYDTDHNLIWILPHGNIARIERQD